jgi:Periplasmic copper-binding protein (NosD)
MRITASISLLLALALIAAAPASAQVVTCGQVITSNTTVENDLSCSSEVLDPGEAALTIGAPNITLDLNGHQITSSRVGLHNDGYDGVTVRDGRIAATGQTMEVNGVSGNTIAYVVFGGIVDGLRVRDSDHLRVARNEIQGVTFYVEADDSVVAHNRATGSWESIIGVTGSHDRIVENSTAGSNLNVRIRQSRLARNEIRLANIPALVSFSDDNVIADNVIVGAAQDFGGPIWEIEASNRNVFRGNKIFRGRTFLEPSDGNVFRENVWFGSPGDGLLITAAATGTRLIDNLAVGNADDGFDVQAPGTRLRENTADMNGDLGIEADPGVIDAGGNTASGNGNPLQCTNVFCG